MMASPQMSSLGQLIFQSLLVALIGSSVLQMLLLDRRLTTGFVSAEQYPLTSVLPKLESLHEEVKSLLIKNAELKDKILAALQAQNRYKMRLVQAVKLSAQSMNKSNGLANATNVAAFAPRPVSNIEQQFANKTNTSNRQQYNGSPTKIQPQQFNKNSTSTSSGANKQTPSASLTMKQKSNADDPSNRSMIDFNQLEDFNKWVEMSLDYAFKNTQATMEALKEEAQQNKGNVEYSDQAIKDGLEGVKYWQSAVMFQDKTLKNEKFDSIDDKDI